MKFGELTGGLITSGDGLYIEREPKEQRSLEDLKMLIQMKKEYRLLYLYTYQQEDLDILTKTAKRYLHSLEATDGMNCLYVTADSLPVGETDVRVKFQDVEFLVIDKIVRIVLIWQMMSIRLELFLRDKPLQILHLANGLLI